MKQQEQSRFDIRDLGEMVIPIASGILGLVLGWIGWQVFNVPCWDILFIGNSGCSEMWINNYKNITAVAPAIVGWGIGTGVGNWIKEVMNRKERLRYEQRIAELERELKESKRLREEETIKISQRYDEEARIRYDTTIKQNELLESLVKTLERMQQGSIGAENHDLENRSTSKPEELNDED